MADDVGKTLKVKVSFTDGGGTEETLESAATAAVVAKQEDCADDRPNAEWCTTMTVGTFVSAVPPLTSSGYFTQNSIRYGMLDDTDIEYGGETRTVSKLQFSDGPTVDVYNINLNAFVPRGTEFDIGGNAVTANAGAERATIGEYGWNATNPPGWLDGQKVTVSANLPPTLVSAAVDGTSLVLTYHEDLDTGSTPAASAYAVTVAGTAVTVSGVSVSGKTVTLTLAQAATTGQTVTVSYTVPTSNPVQDESGLDAPAFGATDYTVLNYTGVTNFAPTVAKEIEDQVARAGTPFSFTFPADTFEDTDGDPLTYTATKGDDTPLPGWLVFVGVSRAFVGEPKAEHVGTLTVKVTASDGTDSIDDAFDIVVRAALTPPPTSGTEVPTDWALTPSGLSAGEKFRLIFASSTKRNAESTDIVDYNTFVQERAAAGHGAIQAYSSGFRVVGCTEEVDATVNTATTGTGVPIYWLGGNQVADDYADFYDGDWDDEANPTDESGSARNLSDTNNNPFTGCQDDGTEAFTSGLDSRALGAGELAMVGKPNSADTSVDPGPIGSNEAHLSNLNRPFYGLSEVFEVLIDTTAPSATSATVNGKRLVLTFDETLAAAAHLANGAFEVNRTPPGGSEEAVTLAGAPTISGAKVTLTLAAAVAPGDAVTVRYAKPTTGTDNRLEDASGNEVASFTLTAVNNTQTAGKGDLRLVVDNEGGLATDADIEDGGGNVVGRVATGRLEAFYRGEWGTVCDDRFERDFLDHSQVDLDEHDDQDDFKVANIAPALACRLMGYENGGEVVSRVLGGVTVAPLAPDDQPIWLDDVRCAEGSTHWTGESGRSGRLPSALHHCYHAGIGLENCTHDEDVHLRCTGPATSAQTTALTAEFTNAPPGHIGAGTFTLQLLFSEPVANSADDLKDHAISVTGGSVQNVAPASGRTDLWNLTIAPDGNADVTVDIDTGGTCNEPGVVCTSGGTVLSEVESATIEGPGVPALTVAFENAPASHDGSTKFKVELVFSEAPHERGNQDILAALEVSGGTKIKMRRIDKDKAHRRVTVEPAGDAAVTLSFPATTDCAAANALCTADGGKLAANSITVEGPQATVRSPAPAALTADFDNPPKEHRGNERLDLFIVFSAEPQGGKDAVHGSLRVEGGAKRNVKATNDEATRFRARIVPNGFGPMTVTLAASADCADANALCSAAGGRLETAVTVTIPGPVAISVADARVEEADGAKLVFAVTLDRPRHDTVTVDYATEDGSAAVDDDYTETEGTLTFAAGETSKTVEVAVHDDAHDEGEETMVLRLSNPVGARIADGEAVGTIENTDHMPKAWLGRFGRTVADQVLDAVEGRMRAPRAPGAEVRLAGQRLGLGPAFGTEAAPEGGEEAASLRARESEAEAAQAGRRLAAWLSGAADEEDRSGVETRTVTQRELLLGSSFSLTAGAADGAGGSASLWGRSAVSRFDGREGELSLDGEVASGLLGADWTRGRSTAGLVVSHSRGEGGYRASSRSERHFEASSRSERHFEASSRSERHFEASSRSERHFEASSRSERNPGEGGAGTVSSTLTGLYPWGRHALSERVSVWGVAGYGEGTLTLRPEGDDGERLAAIRTDTDLAMGAVGVRGVAVAAPSDGGVELSVTSDALGVRTTSDAVRGGTGNLAASEADVTRVRLGLEGSWRGLVLGTGTLEPRLELGARHDGGDAETGFGVDAGGGVVWSDPARGVRAELGGRGLLTHESAGFADRGFAASLVFDPAPASERGPSLTLARTVGESATGGMEALLRPESARALGAAEEDALSRRRFEARLGYGFAVLGGGWTGVPELGLGWSESARETVFGARLLEARGAGLAFGLDVEGRRVESVAGGEAAPEHRLGLGFGWRLEGARRGSFEVRFEGARVEPGDEAPGHEVGLRLTARW